MSKWNGGGALLVGVLGFLVACGDDTVSLAVPAQFDAGPVAAASAPGAMQVPDCSIPAPAACDLVTGCGCAAGEECRIDASLPGAAGCFPAGGTQRPAYSTCETERDCPPLHSCLSSVCRKHCRAPQDCGWDAARCVPAADDAGAPLAASYCPRDCDLASPQGPDPGFQACGAGVRCVLSGDGTDCIGAAGGAAAGAACASTEECAAGLFCSGAGRCERWCKVGGDDCGDQRCVGSSPPLRAGAVELGACQCQPPDGAACDIGVGCGGCPGGTTCGLNDLGRVGCRSLAASPVPARGRCTFDVDCPALHACIGGACQKQCVVPADCDVPGAECRPVVDELGQAISGFNYCSGKCDPISPQAPSGARQPCGPGATCVPLEDGALCLGGGTAAEGDVCSGLRGCAAGLFCAEGNRCQRWCEVGQDGCGAGRTCKGYTPAFVSDGRELGRCLCVPAGGGVCDPRTDCGCDPGGTCDYFPDQGAFDCRVLAASPLPPHAACTTEESCPALHTCMGGVCKKLCLGPADCVAPGSLCVPVEDIAFGARSPWNFCSISCDPVSPWSPSSGFEICGGQCLPATQGSDCFAPPGPGAEGSSCDSSADCLSGFFCGIGGRCQAWCEIGGSSCLPGLTCQGFAAPLQAADKSYGRCLCVPPGAPTAVCDLTSDCGCDPGTTCGIEALTPEGDLSFACRPLPDTPVEPYAACSDDLACPPLHSCLGGVCERHCNTELDCDWPGAVCGPLLDAQDQPFPGFNYCRRNCDPVSPTAPLDGLQPCGAGLQCFPFDTGSDCARAGALGLHAACAADSPCLPGLFCGADGECRRWCYADGNECEAPEVCVAFANLSAGGRPLGGCFEE